MVPFASDASRWAPLAGLHRQARSDRQLSSSEFFDPHDLMAAASVGISFWAGGRWFRGLLPLQLSYSLGFWHDFCMALAHELHDEQSRAWREVAGCFNVPQRSLAFGTAAPRSPQPPFRRLRTSRFERAGQKNEGIYRRLGVIRYTSASVDEVLGAARALIATFGGITRMRDLFRLA